MTKSLTTLGGESEILGGESSPPNSPRINTDNLTYIFTYLMRLNK